MAKGKKTGGRKIGSVNKVTGDIKSMILQALDEVGGVEYFKEQALDNSTSFMTLVGKVLPTQVNMNAKQDTKIEFRWKGE